MATLTEFLKKLHSFDNLRKQQFNIETSQWRPCQKMLHDFSEYLLSVNKLTIPQCGESGFSDYHDEDILDCKTLLVSLHKFYAIHYIRADETSGWDNADPVTKKYQALYRMLDTFVRKRKAPSFNHLANYDGICYEIEEWMNLRAISR